MSAARIRSAIENGTSFFRMGNLLSIDDLTIRGGRAHVPEVMTSPRSGSTVTFGRGLAPRVAPILLGRR